jgi:hypothetical protein
MTTDTALQPARRSFLVAGIVAAALLAVPMIPTGFGASLTTLGSAHARHGADDGPNDNGHHTGVDDSGHHGGKGKGKGRGKDHHGPNHA